jgi:hypothetical protein
VRTLLLLLSARATELVSCDAAAALSSATALAHRGYLVAPLLHSAATTAVSASVAEVELHHFSRQLMTRYCAVIAMMQQQLVIYIECCYSLVYISSREAKSHRLLGNGMHDTDTTTVTTLLVL